MRSTSGTLTEEDEKKVPSTAIPSGKEKGDMQTVAISVKIYEQRYLFLGTIVGGSDYTPEVLIDPVEMLLTADIHRLDLCLWDGRGSGEYLDIKERRVSDTGIIFATSSYPLRPGLW